jgi:Pyruvate/2-oxoacid:ferredoxin oxidoreductase delta subunit
MPVMMRKIIEIDQELCDGCGLCVGACHEGAIELVDGKAHLVSDQYCDGLGACLPECPTGAIRMVEKEAAAFDAQAVEVRMAAVHAPAAAPASVPVTMFGLDAACGCPGSAARSLQPQGLQVEHAEQAFVPSELRQWPVQITLVNTRAPYLRNAHLLVAADCTAFAYAAFHRDFIRGRVTLVGCPKLDDNRAYAQKFAEILALNQVRSIQVVRMEVPCCSGIVSAVKWAMQASGVDVPYEEVVIGVNGLIQ